MKKNYLNRILDRILGAAFFAAMVFLFCSCSARIQASISRDPMTKAFAEAGVPLLSRSISPKDFSIPTLEGEYKSLNDFRGKLVFLNFWATWCPPCRDEMPSMEALYQRYRERGLEILAVNLGESRPEVLDFMQDYGLSFPALLDEDGRVGDDYGIRSIPTTFFINQEGMIIMRKVGSIDWDAPEIHTALELLLN